MNRDRQIVCMMGWLIAFLGLLLIGNVGLVYEGRHKVESLTQENKEMWSTLNEEVGRSVDCQLELLDLQVQWSALGVDLFSLTRDNPKHETNKAKKDNE